MKRTTRIFSRVVGILIFTLSPMCGVLAENDSRHNDSRLATLGDFYRFQDQINARMDRLEVRLSRLDDRVEHLGGRLILTLTVMLGGALGIIIFLLVQPEKPRESARLKLGADKSPPASAH